MNNDNVYDLELNDINLLAYQPEKILLKLKPHQLTSLYKAIEMENKGEIKYKIRDSNLIYNIDNSNLTNIKIQTNIGIFGDTVGYGKTLIALSLIASNKLNNIYINSNYIKTHNSTKNYNYLNITYDNSLIKKENNIINTTLVIVPRGPVYTQWEKMIKENTKLKILAINNYNFIKTNLPKYDGNNINEIYNYFENFDLVLIKNTTLKILINNYYNYSNFIYSWKRIMIDEAHDIIHQIPDNLNYYYLWLISGTYIDILKKINNNYTNGIKKLMNDTSINLILVKNNIDFIKKSFKLPEPIEKYYLCKLDSNFIIAKKFLNNSVMEKINANDFTGAIKELGGKNETEDNIIELVSKELKRELYNLEIEKTFILNQDISQEDKETKLKNINIKINNKNNKIIDLTERIKSLHTNNCIICMDTVKNPVMLDCTHLYCGSCIFKWVKDNKNCPYCRTPILSYDKLIAIVNEKVDSHIDKEIILTKEDTFINIIKNKPNGKFIVFSKNDLGFELIKGKMNENNIKYDFLKGNTSHMLNILEKFKNGQINIILLNTQYAGSGIDINYATDVIIFHSMGLDKLQAIGRAQRVGRTTELYIHNLTYEHEI